MSKMKKIILSATILAFIVETSMASSFLTGGNVPLVNSLVGVGVLTLDLSNSFKDITIGTFVFNENSSNFAVTWTFANKGAFVSVRGDTIKMDSVRLVEGLDTNSNGNHGYYFGTGLTRTFVKGNPINIDSLTTHAAAALTGGIKESTDGSVTWTDSQSTATLNDVIYLKGSWTSSDRVLAGLYTESITYSVLAN
jgi:hypothetical protein